MNKIDSEKYIVLCNGSVVKLADSLKTLRNAGVENSSDSSMSRENQLKIAIWNMVTKLDITKHSFKVNTRNKSDISSRRT